MMCLPLKLLFVTMAGWLHREQQQVIEYLLEANRVLREHPPGSRIRLTDSKHCRLSPGDIGNRIGFGADCDYGRLPD